MVVAQSVRIAGVDVPRIGFAGISLAGPGGWGAPVDRAAASQLLRFAIETGVRYIDTADTLGPGTSEEVIRETLHPYADGLVVATKAGMTRAGLRDWGVCGRPDYLKQQAYTSLHRLRVDTIPLYFLHRVDPDVPFADQIGALKELKDAGVIGHVGLSAVTLAQFEAAREIVDIDAVQSHFNVVSRANAPVVARAAELGIPFIAFWGLGHGPGLSEAPEVQAVAARLGATGAQVLIAWLLHYSPNLVAIPGTGSARHLESNFEARALELDAEALSTLDAFAATSRPVPDIPSSPTTP